MRLTILVWITCMLWVGSSQTQSRLYDICKVPEITESGTLLTPNRVTGQQGYPLSLTCESTIINPGGGGSVRFYFNLFDLEYKNSKDRCQYDYLKINGQRYCAGLSNFELCLNEAEIELQFISDDWEGTQDLYTGFEIRITISPTEQCQCTTVADPQTGEGGGVSCVFPFKHNGIERHQCVGSAAPFCATSVTQTAPTMEVDGTRARCSVNNDCVYSGVTLEQCQNHCLSNEFPDTCTADGLNDNGTERTCNFVSYSSSSSICQIDESCDLYERATPGGWNIYRKVTPTGDLVTQGFCNKSSSACEQKCLSTSGRKCLFPYVHAGSGVEVFACPKFKTTTDDLEFKCPDERGRTFSTANVNYGKLEDLSLTECGQTACLFREPCGTHSTEMEGQLVSLIDPVIIDGSSEYEANHLCNFSFASTESKFYKFVFYDLNTWCADELILQSADGSIQYSLCSDTRGTDQSSFEICIPSSEAKINFVTGNTNVVENPERSGFTASYFQIDQSECTVSPTSEADSACSAAEGRYVNESTELRGPLYPQAYPSNSACLWNVVSEIEDVYILVRAVDLDLGIPGSTEFETTDSIVVRDTEGAELVYLPSSSKPYRSILTLSPNLTINFMSSRIFNWHKNFRIEVKFVTLQENTDEFLFHDYCLSEDMQSICQFPFIYDGRNYSGCDFLDEVDESVSCISTKGVKITCNTDIDSCQPETAFFVSTELVFESNSDKVIISWVMSSRYWSYFDVNINGQAYKTEIRTLSVEIQNFTDFALPDKRRSADEAPVLYGVEIFKKSFGLEHRSVYFIIEPNLKIALSALGPRVASINWDSSLIVQRIVVTPHLDAFANATSFQQLERHLQVDPYETNATIPSGETSFDLGAVVSPGIPYKVKVETNNSAVAIESEIYIPPVALTTEVNQIDFSFSGSGKVTFSGSLTSDTICSFIELKSVPASQDNSEPLQLDCGLDNGCIQTNGSFYTEIISDNFQYGLCYDMYITSSTLASNSKVSLIEMCLEPPMINSSTVQVAERSSESLKLIWEAPTPNNFDVYLADVSFCTDCSCASIEVLEEFLLNDPELELDGLIPGVQYRINLTTVVNHGNIETKIDFSDPLSVEEDTLAIDADPVDIVFTNNRLYLNWAVPALGPDEVGTVGFRNGFKVTLLDNNDIIEETFTREAGSFNDVQLNFARPAHLYTVKLQTVSCSGIQTSEGLELNQVSPPENLKENEFVLTDVTTTGFKVECNRDAPDVEGNTEVTFAVEIADDSGKVIRDFELDCSEAQRSQELTDLDPENTYTVEVKAKASNANSYVQSVYSDPISSNIRVLPEGAEIKATEVSAEFTLPRSALQFPAGVTQFYILVAEAEEISPTLDQAETFSTWKQVYATDNGETENVKVYQATSQMAYPPQNSSNVFDLGNDLYMFKIGTETYRDCLNKTESEICDSQLMSGTFYSLLIVGLLPNGTRVIGGRDFGVFKTADLITNFSVILSSSTSLKVEFKDDISTQDTIYNLKYQFEGPVLEEQRQKRSAGDNSASATTNTTSETISSSKRKICSNIDGEAGANTGCFMYIHGLDPFSKYILEVSLEIGGVNSTDTWTGEADTIKKENDVGPGDGDVLSLSAIPPFLQDPNIHEVVILVGVRRNSLENVTIPYNNWDDVFGVPAGDSPARGVYQPYPPFNYSTIDEIPGLSIEDGQLKLTIGEGDSDDNCTYCNKALPDDDSTKYYIWFIGQLEDEHPLISGPYGAFSASVSKSSDFASAGIGLLFAIIFFILILILVILLVVYYRRHGRNKLRKPIESHEHPVFVHNPLNEADLQSCSEYPKSPGSDTPASGMWGGVGGWGNDEIDGGMFARSPALPEAEIEPMYEEDKTVSPNQVQITSVPNRNSVVSSDESIPRLTTNFAPAFLANPVAETANQIEPTESNAAQDNEGFVAEAEFAVNPTSPDEM